jgi:hypothetical protein
MIKFSVWLENKIKAIRTASDDELDQVVKGEPYTSPRLRRINYLANGGKPFDPSSPVNDYFKHYVGVNKARSRKANKDRAWTLGLEVPEEDREIIRVGDISKPNNAVPYLKPDHIKTITRLGLGKQKPRDAQRFVDTYKRLFGDR